MLDLKCLPVDDPLRITSGYGPRNTGIAGASSYHRGVDLGEERSRCKGSSDGGPVTAVMGGVVVSSYYNSARGWVVLLDHGTIDGRNVKTLYQLKVKASAPYGRTCRSAPLHTSGLNRSTETIHRIVS